MIGCLAMPCHTCSSEYVHCLEFGEPSLRSDRGSAGYTLFLPLHPTLLFIWPIPSPDQGVCSRGCWTELTKSVVCPLLGSELPLGCVVVKVSSQRLNVTAAAAATTTAALVPSRVGEV